MRKAFLAIVLSCGGLPSYVSAYELVLNPAPQVTKDTCQSYQLAFALAATSDRRYNVDTAMQLRERESEIRAAIVGAANSASGAERGATTNHENWRRAVAQYTGGAYTLKEKYYKTLPEFYQAVGELTGNDSVQITGAVLGAFIATRPVLTSVSKVGPHSYENGHIVTIFGVGSAQAHATPRPDALRPLAMLNSAIKLGDKDRNMCSLKSDDGDSRYRAEVYLQSQYTLRSFDGGFKLLWIEKSK